MKVLIADSIDPEGIKALSEYAEVVVKTGLKPEELISIIGEYDGIMVRSQTQVTADVINASKKLQIIGRAGVGVDNIDIECATQHGVVVVNAPTGNTVSAAEHTVALMLSLSRNIPQANVSLKKGEWKRKQFMGTELRNKTLGVIGLGNVGSEVARRARAFKMRIIGFDPIITEERAKQIEVELFEDLKKMLAESDYVTLHIPLTPLTKNIIGPEEIAVMKPTARIVNCARGGLIDEALLAQAVKDNKLAGAAVDVFPTEPPGKSPLFEVDNIIVTPHLGASTKEAQLAAASDVAEQFICIAKGEPCQHALNAPQIAVEELPLMRSFSVISQRVAKLAYRLAEGQSKKIKIKYEGDIADHDTIALKAAILGGLLENISEERVNMVNVNLIAEKRGIPLIEETTNFCEHYASMVEMEITTSSGVTTVSGTVLRGEPHIVRINNYWLDIVPQHGYYLFCDHLDRPGLISAASKVTGDANVNISAMHVGRLKPRGEAIMVLALDEALDDIQLQQMLAIPDVYSAKLIKF